jgi:hypothetical protein
MQTTCHKAERLKQPVHPFAGLLERTDDQETPEGRQWLRLHGSEQRRTIGSGRFVPTYLAGATAPRWIREPAPRCGKEPAKQRQQSQGGSWTLIVPTTRGSEEHSRSKGLVGSR